MIDHYRKLDARLVAAGFPPTSEWWLATLERFYSSGCRQLVLRCGRRGGKSSTLCRVGVLEALAGEHRVPPGDIGIVGIVSVSRDEAAKRLRTIEAILRALDVPYKPLREGQGFELVDRRVGFQPFTASIAGVSGPTLIAAIGDEVAKWRDSDTGANPATEVLASLRPTIATMPNAKLFLSSSPLSTIDAHAEAFDKGDNEFQLVAHAETWIANPSVTEAETHQLEPDQRIWSREYAAIPSASVSAAFDQDAVARAFAPRERPLQPCKQVMVIDPSSLANDEFAWARVGYCAEHEDDRYVRRVDGEIWRTSSGPMVREDWKPIAPYLRVHEIGGYAGGVWASTSAGQIVRELAAKCVEHGITQVVSDQRESFSLAELFTEKGLIFTPIDWTAGSKQLGVERVRRWLADGTLSLPADDQLRKQLATFAEKFTPSGTITFGARGSAHDDRVALLMSAGLADLQGLLSREPNPQRFTEWRYPFAAGCGYV